MEHLVPLPICIFYICPFQFFKQIQEVVKSGRNCEIHDDNEDGHGIIAIAISSLIKSNFKNPHDADEDNEGQRGIAQ